MATNAGEIYQAARAQRRVLLDQLSDLEEKRLAIARRLREGKVTGADKAGLDARLIELDGRIASTDKLIAQADARLAEAAGLPGAVAIERPRQNGIPDEAFVFGGLVMIAAILPLSIAWARRIIRRGGAPTSPTKDFDERFTRLEQALDAVAIEVERVGESQRYVSKMLGPGAAQPIEIQQREALRQSR